jgi:hypothetical protein
MLGSQVWAKCRPVWAAALVVGLLAVGSGPGEAVMPRGWAGGPGVEETRAVARRLAVLERGWVPNAGQWDERAAFAAPGFFGITWVTKEGELRHVASKEECEKPTPEAREPEVGAKRFRKPCPVQSWVVSERWVGGKVKGIRGEEELETKVSFFLGNDPAKHRSGLPSYRYVSLGEVWPGVEVKLKASQKTVEKLFYVRPGADLAKVRVELRGANRLRLSQEGELVIETSLGELKLSKPVAWQEKDGQKLPVQASYRVFGKNRYGFAVQGADPRLPLVIDPILQSTYLGGSGVDSAHAVAIAPSGDVYVAGYTYSDDFPNTLGGAQASCSSCSSDHADAFVARLSADLTSNPQSTYLGGRWGDAASALAIAPSGDVYVAGETDSDDFPNTAGGAQESKGAVFGDAFVARLNSALTQNPQSTYLGGNGSDDAYALAIHPSTGEVYVAGYTFSTNFPNTAGGAQESYSVFGDAFVARLNAALTQNPQSTYLGGNGSDYAYALAIHPSTGEVYVAGYTYSTDFPNTAGGAQESYSVFGDAFVARLNAALTQNPQSTYLGGNGYDDARALAIAGNGEVYVAGYTLSTNFPNTAGGAQASKDGNSDAFVARLNASLTSNPQSTYLGGNGYDRAYALAIHPSTGEVYVAGPTDSTDFPHTAGGAQESYGGGSDDAFVARLNAALTQNPQSTYLGGNGGDYAYALAIHPSTGEVYVAGPTDSPNFPHTASGAQESYGGGSDDAFVARLMRDLQALSAANLSIQDPNGNGVWDSGEAIVVAPAWTNNESAAITVTGTASNVVAPPGVMAYLLDPTANYGSIPPATPGSCSATGDCYVLRGAEAAMAMRT